MVYVATASLFCWILKKVSTLDDSFSPGILWLQTGRRQVFLQATDNCW